MSFEVRFDVAWYLPVVFAAVSVLLALFMYRRVEGLTRSRQAVLVSLRALSLFLLFLAIVNLVTNFIRIDYRKKTLLLLLDDSKSMSLADDGVGRSQVVRQIIESNELKSLRRFLDMKPIIFGAGVLRGISMDSIRFDQPATNIESAVERARSLGTNGSTALALLISDGNYNTSANPVDAARDLPFPLYTVGVGDTALPRDVVVKQVLVPPSLYAGKPSVVRGIVSAHGFGGQVVSAHLVDDNREVGSLPVKLPADGDVEVSFEYTPSTPGMHVLRVYVPSLDGEFSRKNNSAAVTADVRKGKYDLLLVAGEPAADVAFIRRNLEAAGDFNVTLLVQRTGEMFFQKDAQSTLAGKFDAVILYDFPNDESSQTLRLVSDLLSRSDVPYAYFAGPRFSGAKTDALRGFPFSTAGGESGEYQVGIAPVKSDYLPSELQQIYSLLSANASLLPPLYYRRIFCRPAPNSFSLAFPVISGVRGDMPILLVNSAQRSAAFLGYGLWRLQLMSSLSGLRSDFLQEFLSGLIRSLMNGGRQKLLTVKPDKKAYDPSEHVNFNALLVGPGGSPLNGATVDLVITDESSKRVVSNLRLTQTGDGSYAGVVAGLGEGKYSFAAKALAGSTFAGTDSGTVVVEPMNVEYARTQMNAQLLRQLALVTGGEFLTPAQFMHDGIHLNEQLKEPARLTESSHFELLSTLPILAFVLLLLASEWFLRKIWGLP